MVKEMWMISGPMTTLAALREWFWHHKDKTTGSLLLDPDMSSEPRVSEWID